MNRYELNPDIVRSVILLKLQSQPYDQNQMMFYHLNRNHFNVKGEVSRLDSIGSSNFRDNFGHVWTELSTLKNFFHMPKGNYVMSLLGITTPYSRKFIRDDDVSGVFGEFEMIIRHDGKRVDGLTHLEYQETYNFGRTRNFSEHKALDVDTHNANSNYEIKADMGWTKINDN